jgi:NADPH:quinone reductase-like Zn-dependent oxidoreductase
MGATAARFRGPKRAGLVGRASSMERDRMRVELEPLEDQVIVIAGASSGIGLVTARIAARYGAKVVANARN